MVNKVKRIRQQQRTVSETIIRNNNKCLFMGLKRRLYKLYLFFSEKFPFILILLYRLNANLQNNN